MKVSILLAFALLVCGVFGDVYLHSPRGSNDRLKGANRNRNNANRLFDSQNNDRGGYNVGSLYYYQGSKSVVEWTTQHSCGNANNRCELILQYTCDDRLRDGTTETTIPTAAANCDDSNCDTDPRYGRHESWQYYTYCSKRQRNNGLFTADQLNEHKKDARYTRQNAGATRYGYECAEERDYYPYWGPSPWRDIAVLTNEPQRCAAYQAESQNVKGRYYCKVFDVFHKDVGLIPIDEQSCNAFVDKSHPDNTATTPVMAQWTYVPPFGLAPPECRQNRYVRDNHLGNTVGGQPASYNWTMPNDIHERCVFRIRYNTTSYDYDGFESLRSIAAGPYTAAKNNKSYLNEQYGFGTGADAETAAKNRGYELRNNPEVDIFGDLLGANVGKVKLQLNINTAQFFRTFEDRSHRFAVRSREGKYPADAVIHNINVRGKRGNIVQTYPGNEYDFTPNLLDASIGDYVHFQWTGSDQNPGNNDGQGRAGTDRSNVVGLVRKRYDDAVDKNLVVTEGSRPANYPKKLTADLNFLGWDNTTLIELATLSSKQFGGDMDQFNDAGTYFDLPPKMLGKAGIFNYMCTRNNNFSNRSQKGTIKVENNRAVAALIGWNGGVIDVNDKAKLTVKEGVFDSVQELALTVSPAYILDSYGIDSSVIASSVIVLSGAVVDERLVAPVELTIEHTASPVADTYIAYAPTLNGLKDTDWVKMSTTVDSGRATTTTDMPGVYVVKEDINIFAIIGISIGGLVLVLGAAYAIMYCRKKALEDQLKAYETHSLVSSSVNNSSV